MEPSDPHDLRNTDDAAIETVHLAIEGSGKSDSVTKAGEALKKAPGVLNVDGENASGILTVTFDARITHVPALHDVLLQSGYHPARSATD